MSQKTLILVAAVMVIGLPLSAAATIMVRSALTELRIDFRPRVGPVAVPDGREWPGIESVTIACPDGTALAAFYMAPTNGRVVILLHGTGADRSQMLPEARILARNGYGVLAFDWPGHGESTGAVHWNDGERRAVQSALDWAAVKPGVDGQALGVLGFSMGSWFAIQATVKDPRIKALALTGPFAELQATFEMGRWGWLNSWPALAMAAWNGMRVDENRSSELIGLIAPRPVLLIAGTQDDVIPPAMTRQLFVAAAEPKTLWIAEGAGHGSYAAADPEGYQRTLVAFFAESLKPTAPNL